MSRASKRAAGAANAREAGEGVSLFACQRRIWISPRRSARTANSSTPRLQRYTHAHARQTSQQLGWMDIENNRVCGAQNKAVRFLPLAACCGVSVWDGWARGYGFFIAPSLHTDGV